MKITEDTKAMAQRVYDYIIMNPENHSQKMWVGKNDVGISRVNQTVLDHCGTTMCIAGTAVYLSEGIKGLDEAARLGDWFSDKITSLLGFEGESEAQMLFYTMHDSKALDMLNALAQGDEEKFTDIYAAG